jgi:CheY-like chemotaxis protein
MMGGRVGFESVEGKGSDFWVELPVHVERERPPAPEPTGERKSIAGHGSRLIVYVEDNPSNVAFMQDLMSDLDEMELLVATSAEAGIELARARRPALIIMDINLPGISGIEALKRLQQWPETRETPVVALSAAAMVGEAKRIEQAGFSRYLTKPVQVDELLGVLQDLLADAGHAS